MKKIWLWVAGAVVTLAVLTAAFFGPVSYLNTPMMSGAYGWRMPMMYGGYGMMGGGTMVLAWLIQIGLLVLIGLACAWLIRQLKETKK